MRPDSHRLSTFRQDCRHSQSLSFTNVRYEPNINDFMFSVTSGQDPTVVYTVQILMGSYQECPKYPSCPFFDPQCGFCAHAITCTCPRMRLGSELSCKHCHLVARYSTSQLKRPLSDSRMIQAAKALLVQQSSPAAAQAQSFSLSPSPSKQSNPPYVPSPTQPALSEAFKEFAKLSKVMHGLKHAQGPQMDALAAEIKKARVAADNLSHLSHGRHAVGQSNSAANAKVQPQRRLFAQAASAGAPAPQAKKPRLSSASSVG